MKQMKKLLAGLLTAALLVSLVPAVLATPAEEDLLKILDRLYAEKNGTVALLDAGSATRPEKEDKEHAAEISIGQVIVGADGTASVPVYVTAPAGLSGVQVNITYDEGLTYVAAENSESFSDKYSVADVRDDETTANSLRLAFGSADNVTEAADNFLLTTLCFKVEAEVTAGTVLPVTVGTVDYVTYWEADEEDIYKVTYGTVEKSDGSVTAPTTAVITIGNKNMSAKVGGTVTVPVSISADYPGGVNGIQMTILYEEDVLSIDVTDPYAACFVDEAAEAEVTSICAGVLGLSLMWGNSGNIPLDGQIAELTFAVKPDVTAESTDIDGVVTHLTYEDSDGRIDHEYDNTQVIPGTVALSSTPAPAYLLGDVNGDGSINAQDAIALNLHLSGGSQLEGTGLLAADIYSDGTINAQDAIKLNQFLAGNIDSFD